MANQDHINILLKQGVPTWDMANQDHLDILKQGVPTWNRWREEHPEIEPNLRHVSLSKANLSEANLSETDLLGADLSEANLTEANLSEACLIDTDLRNANFNNAYLRNANLHGTNLSKTDLSKVDFSSTSICEANLSETNLTEAILAGAALCSTDLSHANLSEADLSGANLDSANLYKANLYRAFLEEAFLKETNFREANLCEADLRNADLRKTNLRYAMLDKANLESASLMGADLTGASLIDCLIHGISVWQVKLEGAKQTALVITDDDEPVITVDNLNLAQFIYLLLNNAEIRDVIDTITSKVVLILGRFTPERKAVLDVLRDELRKHNYSPVLFDFEKPASRDLTGTVSILAHLARFIIVDLTDPSSTPHEVTTVIPQTVVPVQPLLWQEPLMVDGKVVERREYALFEDLRRRYHWVLPTFRYQDTADLLVSIKVQVIEPAEQKVKELTGLEKRIVSSETHTINL